MAKEPEVKAVPNNVFGYFKRRLEVYPNDKTLAELPVDSPCGKDCVEAIDRMVEYLKSVKVAGGDVAGCYRSINEVIEIFWRG